MNNLYNLALAFYEGFQQFITKTMPIIITR